MRWDNESMISMDIMLGINHMKYYLFTLIVFDNFHGMPIVWIITSQLEKDLIHWLNILYESHENSS